MYKRLAKAKVVMPTSNCWYILMFLYALVMYGYAAEVCDVLKDKAESARYLATNGETKWVDTWKGAENESCVPLLSPYNITIYIASGSLLDEAVALRNASLVSIIGYDGPEKTEFQCTGNSSTPSVFQIVNSLQIYIANITFKNCGPEQSNVFITESVDVVFENCVFSDNTASSVLAYEIDSVAFISCVFTNNHIVRFPAASASSTYNSTAAGSLSLFAQRRPGNFLVLSSRFFNNYAEIDELVLDYAQGGAISIRALGNYTQVCIEQTVFDSNRAENDGGAIAVTMGNGTFNAALVISNSTFYNNSCAHPLCSGGAISIAVKEKSLYNVIEIISTSFTSNNASTGGAVAVSTADNVEGSDNDTLMIINCTFSGNTAYYDGTALGAYSLVLVDEISLSIQVQNCNFSGNAPSYGQDSSTINIYHTLIVFKGYTLIFDNVGGGIALLDSQMAIEGRVDLINNTAVYGGGIATSGRSLIVMYNNSYLSFVNNSALQEGGGLYVEYTSNAYFLTILNKNCFLQYYSNVTDIPPNKWNATIEFFNNVAGRGGAAIFSTDFSQCAWFGDIEYDGYTYIFLNQSNYTNSPFKMSGNKVLTGSVQGSVNEMSLASEPSVLILTEPVKQDVSFGEKVYIPLESRDQLNNSRESVYSVNFPATQKLGSLSSTGGGITYVIPAANELQGIIDNAVNISITITLLNNETSALTVDLYVKGCHPGYVFDDATQQCICTPNQTSTIARCDDNNRYFYSLGYWVGVTPNNTVYFGKTIPGFLNCTAQGLLQGCLFKYDDTVAQCAKGREGTLCGQCIQDYGPTFDLQFCDNNCGAGGIVLYIVVCCFVVIFSIIVLHWDIKFPDELKGFIFYAQVIGVIYRSSSTLALHNRFAQNKVFSFMINMLGYALPFPVCLWKNSSVLLVSGLGIIPSILATLAAFTYGFCAHRGNILQHSKSYSFHGFYFIYLFAYKYYLDASFVFISCQKLEATGQTVFTYNGDIECLKPPLVVLFVFGLLVALILGVLLPLYFLYLLYRRTRFLQVYNVFTDGLKVKRRYIWYGVWSIWRRLPFVATSLLVATLTQETILFVHCIVSLLCLLIVCIVQPYKKFYINVIEAFTLLCLFCATIALLDDEDVYVNGISTLGIIFTCLPFCFAGLYIIALLGLYVWKLLNRYWELNTQLETYLDNIKSMYLRRRYNPENIEIRSPECDDRAGDAATADAETSVADWSKYVELREPLLQNTE